MTKHSASRADAATLKQDSLLRRVALPVILALTSICVMLYPVVVTQLSNMEQLKASSTFNEQISNTSDEDLSQTLDAALEYNKEQASGPILDPWLARISTDNADYQQYLAQLNQTDAMARLVVPSINVDLPVYHGTSEETLQKGIGHLYGTDLPVGGEGSHAVLTGHTGLTSATLFDNLNKVKVGDAIYLSVAGEQLKYQVYDIEVVLPEDSSSLKAVEGKDLLTLITCTPYGINDHRLLVHAERVPMDPADVANIAAPSSLNWQWWMFGLMGGSALLALGMAVWVRKTAKSMQQQPPSGAASGGIGRHGHASRPEDDRRPVGSRRPVGRHVGGHVGEASPKHAFTSVSVTPGV